ncbi:DUF1176 domain-containing protein [Sphaerothrix gracilis]|uniref:DUF1176 domain-containing protein n=1 Tax=Sphaerothrix gracilis TaxID=3151835 RepID=UPI0031FCDF7F
MRSLKLMFCVGLLLAGCGQTNTVVEESPDLEVTETPPLVAPEDAEEADDSLAQRDLIVQAVYDSADELNLCDGYLEAETLDDSEVYVLSADQYLVQFLCNFAAYQGVYEFLIYTDDGADAVVTPLELTVYVPDETGQFTPMSDRLVAGLPFFDTEEQVLTNFTKGRGIGDCGSFARYEWNGELLELIEYRYRECDSEGAPFIEPEDYPQVYP